VCGCGSTEVGSACARDDEVPKFGMIGSYALLGRDVMAMR